MKTIHWVALVGVVLVLILGGSALLAGGGEPHYDDASPVMYFYSESCVYCQQQKPILRELAARGFRVKPMDVARNPALWQQFDVRGTPTFVAGNGDRLEGFQPREALEPWLAAHGARIA